jgi:hypothetical protein
MSRVDLSNCMALSAPAWHGGANGPPRSALSFLMACTARWRFRPLARTHCAVVAVPSSSTRYFCVAPELSGFVVAVRSWDREDSPISSACRRRSEGKFLLRYVIEETVL